MSERWLVEWLDSDENRVGELPITGGSLDWSVDRPIHGGGTIELSQPPAGIDWLSHRIRIIHDVDGSRTPMGVWIPAWPEWDIDGDYRKTSVQLLDKTAVLSREISQISQVTAGTVVTDHVAHVISNRGEQAVAITPSPLTLRDTLTWEPKKTWLQQINDLLAAIGYTDLWCDGNGWFRAEPYRLPAARPLVATYGGEASDLRVLRTYRDAADIADIPNRVVVHSTGSATQAALRAEAALPPNHPLGRDRRGDIPKVADPIEAATVDVLAQHAKRMLSQATDVTRRITFSHPVDGTQLRDRVALRRLAVDGVIVSRKIRLDIGPVVEDTIRRIYQQGEALWI